MNLIEHGVVAVVDDDPSMLSALRRLLASHAFSVHTFSAAEEFLLSPMRDEVACVISDVELGDGMSGLELGETMLACGYGTPFIFMSGTADRQVRRRALALGCVAFLDKPFNPEGLVESVVKAVTGAK